MIQKPSFLPAMVAIFGLLPTGCALTHGSDSLFGSSKGALQVKVSDLHQRTVQAKLSDVDHLLISLETSEHSTFSQPLTQAALYNSNASASVLFPDLWPGEATLSATVYNVSNASIGAATATASVVSNQLTAVNMNLKLDPTDVLAGNLQIVGTILPGAAPPAGYVVTTLAGGSDTGGYLDGSGTSARFDGPQGITIDSTGDLFVIDYNIFRIRKVTSAGLVSTFAGNGIYESEVDGTGTTAGFNHPIEIARAPNGNFFVADFWASTVRKVTPGGVVTTFATNVPNPQGIAVGPTGNVYVSGYISTGGVDPFYSYIYKFTPEGVKSTLAGGGLNGFVNGTGAVARFDYPVGLAVDSQENLYVCDGGLAIRKITPAGVVTTFAGGTMGNLDGTGTAAQFYYPKGIAIDADDNLFVADTSNDRIRKITPSGVVTTVAGGVTGFVDGTGTAAQFCGPWGITIDAVGNLYVTDNWNNAIRKITY